MCEYCRHRFLLLLWIFCNRVSLCRYVRHSIQQSLLELGYIYIYMFTSHGGIILLEEINSGPYMNTYRPFSLLGPHTDSVVCTPFPAHLTSLSLQYEKACSADITSCIVYSGYKVTFIQLRLCCLWGKYIGLNFPTCIRTYIYSYVPCTERF